MRARELIGRRRKLPACRQIEGDDSDCLASSSARSLRQSESVKRDSRSTCSIEQHVAGLRVGNEPEKLRPGELRAGLVLEKHADDGKPALGGERLDLLAGAARVLFDGDWLGDKLWRACRKPFGSI